MCGWLLHHLSMFISHFERIFIGFKCLEKSYMSWNVKTGETPKKVTLCILPVARPVDRILLGLTSRMLVLLVSSAGRWSGRKGGQLDEANLGNF